jgi:hypothetical protein
MMLLTLVMVLSPLGDVVAQGSLSLVPGQRLRLTAPAQGVYDQEMRYVGTRGDTLILTSGVTVAFPFSDVMRLEILRGQRSYKWPGAIIGAACGVLIGVGVGYAATDDGWGSMRKAWVVPAAVGIGVLGAGIGAIVGQSRKTDTWEELPLDSLRVSIAPTRNGFGIGTRIAF